MKQKIILTEDIYILNQVLSIKSSEEYFAKFIAQINLYIDFKRIL